MPPKGSPPLLPAHAVVGVLDAAGASRSGRGWREQGYQGWRLAKKASDRKTLRWTGCEKQLQLNRLGRAELHLHSQAEPAPPQNGTCCSRATWAACSCRSATISAAWRLSERSAWAKICAGSRPHGATCELTRGWSGRGRRPWGATQGRIRKGQVCCVLCACARLSATMLSLLEPVQQVPLPGLLVRQHQPLVERDGHNPPPPERQGAMPVLRACR